MKIQRGAPNTCKKIVESTRTVQTLEEVKEADILIFSNLLEDNLDTMQVHLLRDRGYDTM